MAFWIMVSIIAIVMVVSIIGIIREALKHADKSNKLELLLSIVYFFIAIIVLVILVSYWPLNQYKDLIITGLLTTTLILGLVLGIYGLHFLRKGTQENDDKYSKETYHSIGEQLYVKSFDIWIIMLLGGILTASLTNL